MIEDNTAVYGIFKTEVQAESAVESLKMAGFKPADVSVLFASTYATQDFAHENSTKAPEGATAGGGTGAVVGGALGWLAGIGAITIPGAGLFIAAGPIMGFLAGVGVGGTLGSVTGALIGLGIPEYEAKRYEGRIHKGGVLLSVHSVNSETTKKAKDILEYKGADDISSKGEAAATAAVPEEEEKRPSAVGDY